MAINNIININMSNEFYTIQILLLITLVIYFIMLVLGTDDYLKVLIFFEVIILLMTVIFLINISENIDHIVLILLVMVGAESGLALSIIFPFLIK